jgi:hypothetical protein
MGDLLRSQDISHPPNFAHLGGEGEFFNSHGILRQLTVWPCTVGRGGHRTSGVTRVTDITRSFVQQ